MSEKLKQTDAKATGEAPLPEARGSASSSKGVDMWDQENGSEGTVSNAVRRLTSQWGLPDARHHMLKNKGISSNQ